MGRRGITIADERRWVFNRLAGDYQNRPAYPEALVSRLLEIAGGPGAAVADLGAGTGHLALPLAAGGARVFAVEPARVMLRALQAGLNARCAQAVTAVHAPAERTGLAKGCCDLVLLADALQWVDGERTGREAARILGPGGTLAVVEANLADTPFMRSLSALVAEANFKARPAPAGRRSHLFAAAGVRGLSTERFAHAERLAPGRFDAVLRSLTFVGPALGPDRLAALLDGARRLAEVHGGAVWVRDISLTWGRASGKPPLGR
jgi:SAM-dependent methyltransferase